MDRWIGKVAIVTGASAGLGLATVRALIVKGMIVVGLARRKEKMENEMKTFEGKGKFYALECDVSKEQDVIQTFEWVKKNLGSVHVLINNAGLFVPGKIIDTNKEIWDKVIGVNIMGLLYCTKQAVIMMKESGEEGHIINLNSIVGHRIIRKENTVGANVYPATKHAVTAITSTLEVELLGSKIRSTSISPGCVETEILRVNKNADFKISMVNEPVLQPEDIADSVIYVLGTPPRVQITELTIRPLGERL